MTGCTGRQSDRPTTDPNAATATRGGCARFPRMLQFVGFYHTLKVYCAIFQRFSEFSFDKARRCRMIPFLQFP
jgi:hypothetical protein